MNFENFQRHFGWIDREGKFHKCEAGQLHDDWAHDYVLKNNREVWKLLKSNDVDDSRLFTDYLLQQGWVRQSDCAFETKALNKTSAWNIHDEALKNGCRSILVSYGTRILELTLEEFIEKYG